MQEKKSDEATPLGMLWEKNKQLFCSLKIYDSHNLIRKDRRTYFLKIYNSHNFIRKDRRTSKKKGSGYFYSSSIKNDLILMFFLSKKRPSKFFEKKRSCVSQTLGLIFRRKS
jgi:hypothetical protein